MILIDRNMEINKNPPTCGICMELYNQSQRCPYVIDCGHLFCGTCLDLHT